MTIRRTSALLAVGKSVILGPHGVDGLPLITERGSTGLIIVELVRLLKGETDVNQAVLARLPWIARRQRPSRFLAIDARRAGDVAASA
jgi:hypothetical protein